MIQKHFDKNNLHHAYLIEGNKVDILPELFLFLNVIGIETKANPDFAHIDIDNFKIEEALMLRNMSTQMSFSGGKKVFIVSANSFSSDAQNSMLKMFEEPVANTHFFIIVPEINALIRTFISRFYLIKNENDKIKIKEIEEFLTSTLPVRIEYIKNLLADVEESGDEDEEEIEKTLALESKRSKALKFLNSLEFSLHNKMSKMPIGMSKTVFDTAVFEQIFQARKFIRQPGSSVKMLLESVALSIPEKI